MVVEQQHDRIVAIGQGATALGSLEHGLNLIGHESFLAVAGFQKDLETENARCANAGRATSRALDPLPQLGSRLTAPAAAEAARTLRRVGGEEFLDMASLLGSTRAGHQVNCCKLGSFRP